MVFAVIACGFRARCALEMDDASETRIDKIYSIVEQCRFGIHDISRTELDVVNNLPRFNMPLELGIFLASKRFGDEMQAKKRALVLDVEPYRYQKFISDLAGIDITPHGGEPTKIVECVRNWLSTVSKRTSIPGTANLLANYQAFTTGLPDIAARAGLDSAKLIYPDLERLVVGWVEIKNSV